MPRTGTALLILTLAVGAVMATVFACTSVRAAGPGKSAVDDRWLDPTDARLVKIVGIEARRLKVSEVLEDLSKQTGVTFNAGYNKSDWQVRDRRVIIFAKNVSAAGLMNSIARVTKLKWKKETSGDIVSYRLLLDRKALSEAERRRLKEQADLEARRTAMLGDLDGVGEMSADQVSEIAKSDPYLAARIRTGEARGMADAFRAVPGLAGSFITGQSVAFSTDALSPDGRSAIQGWLRGIAKSGGVPPPAGGATAFQLNRYPTEVNGSMVGFYTFVDAGGGLWQGEIMDPQSSKAAVLGQSELKGMDGEQSSIRMSDLAAAQSEDMAKADIGEPAPDHPDEPSLHRQVKLKPKSNSFGDVLSSLAECSSLPIVSDSFVKQDNPYRHDKGECELKDLLDSVSADYDANWRKQGEVVELTNRCWYRLIAGLIPDDTVEKWRRVVKSAGTLDIEALSEIASLTLEQTDLNVDNDEMIGSIELTTAVVTNQDILRLYAALSPRQKKLLFSKRGLSLADVTPAQWPMVQDLIQRKNNALLDDPNARVAFAGTSSQQGKQTKYTITVSSTGMHTHPTVWTILTPKYDTPAKP